MKPHDPGLWYLVLLCFMDKETSGKHGKVLFCQQAGDLCDLPRESQESLAELGREAKSLLVSRGEDDWGKMSQSTAVWGCVKVAFQLSAHSGEVKGILISSALPQRGKWDSRVKTCRFFSAELIPNRSPSVYTYMDYKSVWKQPNVFWFRSLCVIVGISKFWVQILSKPQVIFFWG